MFEEVKFENGVRLVMVPMEGVESLSVGVFCACGGRYEPEEMSGVSHFLEHMAFKGTKYFPTYDDVHSVERLGGVQNAYTGTDVTKYEAKVLAVDWERALEVVCDLALNPLLPEKDFESERKVILEEMAMYEDDLPVKAGEIYHGLIYKGSALGRRLIGTRGSLGRIGRRQMREYRERNYRAGNLVVVVAGKIVEKRALVEKARKITGEAGRGKNAGFAKAGVMGKGPEVKVFTKKDAQQANLVLGFVACDRFSEDRFALQVFNLLMGVGMTSRLFKRIREKRGLCYAIYSGLGAYHEIGDWAIEAGLNVERLDEAVVAIMAEIKLILDQGVTEEEVESAKKRFAAGAAFRMESPDGLSEFYGRQAVFGQKVLTVGGYLGKIDRVSVSDIERVTKKYFSVDRVRLAVVGRFGGKDEERLYGLLGSSRL